MANTKKVSAKDTLAQLQREQAEKKAKKAKATSSSQQSSDNVTDAVIVPPPSQNTSAPVQPVDIKIETPAATASGGGNVPPPPTPPVSSTRSASLPGGDDIGHLPERPPQDDYSPIKDNPIERPYAIAPPLSATDAATPIPEPIITPPPINNQPPVQPPPGGGSAGATAGASTPPPHIPIPPNPQLVSADPSEVRRAAESAADGILDMYSGVTELARQFVKIDDNQLMQYYEDNKFQPDTTIALGEDGEDVTVVELVQSFNNGCDQSLIVTQEFKEDVRPVLVRVLEKRKIGFTDEELLIEKFGKDIIVKGVTVFKMKSQINGAFNFISKQYEKQKAMGSTISEQEKLIAEQERIIAKMKREAAAAQAASAKGDGEDDVSFGAGKPDTEKTTSKKISTAKTAKDSSKSGAVAAAKKNRSSDYISDADIIGDAGGIREPEEK